MIKENKATNIQSISRAASILRLIAESGEARLTDISSSLGIHKNTVSGLLNTLRAENFVFQNPNTKMYSLGFEILRLSSKINIGLSSVCMPYLYKLRDETGETVNLASYDYDGILYIEKLESPHSVRICTNVGIKLPMTCTAIGKSILAFLDQPEFDRIVHDASYQPYTPNTLCSAEQIQKDIEKIRKTGVAYDMEELEVGLICISAPLFAKGGKPIAGISVSGPAFRMDEAARKTFSALLIDYAGKINKELEEIPEENLTPFSK